MREMNNMTRHHKWKSKINTKVWEKLLSYVPNFGDPNATVTEAWDVASKGYEPTVTELPESNPVEARMKIRDFANLLDETRTMIMSRMIIGPFFVKDDEELFLSSEGGKHFAVHYSPYFGIEKKGKDEVRPLFNQGKNQVINGNLKSGLNNFIIDRYGEMDNLEG